ncbi:MAG: ADP-ribose pyrophosphatase [Alphaproteobacteria bacterium MarineAlpha5_Bin6]|nr:MAG: ADP-ribose pyrophosphatase [Alphaproteobacteria bacterium MarineAlpha5_Bin7]PPR53918.1 MAG: ADP-ribose pyrophosphatase [Alphaproteobacteria bacterium MarineAlpha5_Bin6]|tara:strand:+ start:254 stop:835 length:582 start_codon:yes stop_codon:yes gene_type:complete
MSNNYSIIKKRNLYKGFFNLNEITLKHKKHNGKWTKILKREIFSGSEVAAVLPYDPKNKKIILINQFRTGILKQKINPMINEIVAGIVDKHEKPIEAARRECKEETGCAIKKVKKIVSFFPSPGASESYYHLYLGEVKSFKGFRITGQTQEDEDILAKCYSVNEIKEMLNNNTIINGLSLIALQWFLLNYKKF